MITEELLPLSYAQQRLWFLDQLEPNSASYNIPLALRLVGNLNQAALEQSLQEIIDRHEALRTNFITVDGQPLQIIREQRTGNKEQGIVSIVNLKHLSTNEQEITTQQLVQQEAIQPFDLANQELIRATLVLLNETEYVLLVCMHHVVSDGWSMGVFVQELAALYKAYSEGEPSPLAPLPIQYADFALWQRDWLQGDALQTQLNYWQQQLKDAPTLLSLPTDRPRPAVQTFAGATQEFPLSVELTNRLTKLSQEGGCTLFMTLLTAFDILLYRYTGQSDILVGTPIANRDRSEIEGLIGFFVNTLVMRTNLAGDPSFSELLGRVRQITLGAYTHQELPFEMLVEALQPERNLSHTPLFQVMFALQNAPMSKLELAGLTISFLTAESKTTKFDLSLSMYNSGTGLVGVWEYSTDLFDSSTIERMTGHFVTLLEGIVANPKERISQLPMLTQVEQHQLLVEWNSTQVDYPFDKCIHELFEEQVKRTPDAVAIIFDNQQLTYQQLNCRANQLAHYLQSLGVKPDTLVGICVERSLLMVVGLLGILKAGGAYVPLDPDYPQERLSFMLEDAQVPVLLTQQQLLEKLPQHQAQVVCLDTDWQSISLSSQDNAIVQLTVGITKVQTTNLAYVIYTSGSTGRPKGVLISHGAIANHCCIIQQAYALVQSDRVLQFASINFDASLEQIFPTLIVGACLILRGSDVWTPTNFQKIILDFGLSVVNLPTAYWQQLAQEWVKTQVLDTNSKLRLVVVGGDIILPEYVTQWQQSPMSCVRLVNAYGPTETTITATLFEILPQLSQDINLKKIPIGRPLPNRNIYILDTYLQPVPIGVPGELYIGGVGLAKGYLNLPQLTSEKFIPNPFSTNPNSRLYKTGDLVRYLSDGNIEYLGRIDNQVKIRGFRIELGEIETVLSQHGDVKASCVIVCEDTPGNKRIVAYVVPHQGQIPTVNQLRSFISGQLPAYMMPHAFVMLESLPLLPNGKVDRRALPAPDFRGELEVSFVGPRTPIEGMLAQIWAEVLRLEQVGIYDNFFELGGDSILSIQIISRAKQIGLHLALKQLFAHQTIAELATVANIVNAIAVEQGLVTGTLPLTPIQHYFFEQNFPEPHHFNQSFLLSVPSDLEPELLKQVLQQLLAHHDALRLRFTQYESTWQQIHSAVNDNISFSQIDLSELPESEQQTAIETKAASFQASLNLSENLVQVAFFHLGIDKRARLLIVIHHLVVDGVSWRILLEDLQTAYQQLAQGKAIALTAKTTSFKDWSEKLTAYAQSIALKSEVAYWLNESRAAVPSIPVDHTQGANTVASASTVSVSLNEIETRALLQDVPKAYNTQINDVLLTALVLVLAKWTNSSSVLFNLEGHGREDIVDGVDLSRTIGWFTTIFPVFVELQATENPADALKSVKEELRAIPNKGIGYGLLRYLSQDAEIAAQVQAFGQTEISFNYLGQFDQLLNTSSWMQPASESAGQSQSLQNNRAHLLDINSIIAGERLQIEWIYSTNIHQHATIATLAQDFVKILQGLIAHCSSPESGGYTPSDFPLVNLNQLELDQLLTSLGKTNSKNIEDIYPLSPMQQGMLFESLYAPDTGVYFEQLSFTLKGELNVAAFEQAWQQVVARHSILRTAFVWEQLTQPLQVVYRQVDINLNRHDWQRLSAQDQQEQLELFLHSQRQQGFQLSLAPLMHLALIQLSADTYQFVWSSHHLLLDGWSMPLVFKDLLYFYQAIFQGETKTVQPTQSYRNYIAWLQKQDLALAEQFWKEKLQGFTSPTSLIVDKPSSKRQQLNSSYSEQQIQLTVQATAALQSFARQHQLTINNLVQATWAILLCRYNQETDVVFGATVSGRPPSLIGIESMVGIFINTLPVRVQVADDTQVLALLKDLQALQVESEQYSYSSLVEIQGWSEVPRGTPLFESIVVFENYPVDAAVQEHNHSFDLDNIHSIEQTNYPLTVVAAPGKQFLVKISYDTSRFDDAAIARMLEHFQTLLEGIIANPQQRILQLPLLTATEEQQLLVEWNDTQVDYLQNKCIHQLFEGQVERTPDAIAAVFENQQLTYYQLNAKANQLAHYLRFLGVKADVLVGIYVERSLEMVIGLLGILKAGGAYVPLDTNYPQERLSFMLEDAAVSILLTQQQLVEILPEHQAKLVCLDTNWQLISQFSQDNFISDVQATNLGYVIYTSGSTGKPKGVAMSQLALCNLILWQLENMKISRGAKTLQFSPISFDVSFQEMFSTWYSGGTLLLITEELRRDPVALLALMENKAVERLFIPFVGLQQLAEVAVGGDLFTSNLREIITAGEQLQITPAISHWLSKLTDDCTLHNHYGPSESHVVTTFTLTNSVDAWPLLPPIGRPIANTQIYILDKYLQPVPIGVAGGLYIGGVSLARGYLNRPELTLERFIPNPFSTDTYSRLYKTGDLARYLPDGNIEYLGRIDNQVKVRGFRIELGEIEAVLSQHGDVEACCVITYKDGDQRLVAYIVPHQHCTPTISELRHFLKAKLPEYMVPNAFVMLESLPLTPSGKVDRRALKVFDLHSSDSDKFVAPRNQLELQLAQIWSIILKVDKVGVQDNFFDLGGHSLLTPYLMAQIKQQFGKDIPIASLYQNSTIEQLATVVQADSDSSIWSPLVAIQSNGSKPPLFCLPGAAGTPFYLYDLARCLGSDQPFYSFQANGLSGGSVALTKVEDMAAQYIQELEVVQPQGPYFLAGHSFGGKLAFEMAQQLLRKGHKVALVAILDTSAPFYQEKPEGFDWDNAKWLAQLAGAIEIIYAKKLDISDEILQCLVWEDQLKYVLERLKNADILPPDDEITQLNNMVQLLKANSLVNYVPQQVYPIRITLLRASETPAVEESNSEVLSEILQDSTWGWSKFSPEPMDIHFVPGNHVTMMTQPYVQTLAKQLKACIEEAQETMGDGV